LAVLCCFTAAVLPAPVASPQTHNDGDLRLSGILDRMEEAHRQRQQQLLGYESTQRLLAISGSDVRAELAGVLSYEAPDRMEFEQTNATGSSFIRTHVLLPIIDHEISSVRPDQFRKRSISRENYRFKLVQDDSSGACRCFILQLLPMRKSEGLLNGRIWVDASDYAIRHLDGYLVARPSFWVRSVHVVRDYAKLGPFWMPTLTHTENQVLLFGRTDVDLHSDYQHIRSWPVAVAASSQPAAMAHSDSELVHVRAASMAK
jgi:hypothetical protein